MTQHLPAPTATIRLSRVRAGGKNFSARFCAAWLPSPPHTGIAFCSRLLPLLHCAMRAISVSYLIKLGPIFSPFCCAPTDLRVTRVDTGAVEARLVVSKALTNSYGTLHGGAAATLVDIAGTCVLITRSVESNAQRFPRGTTAHPFSFPVHACSVWHCCPRIRYAQASAWRLTRHTWQLCLWEKRCLSKAAYSRGGRCLGFTAVDIYRADGSIAVTGRHTKAL